MISWFFEFAIELVGNVGLVLTNFSGYFRSSKILSYSLPILHFWTSKNPQKELPYKLFLSSSEFTKFELTYHQLIFLEFVQRHFEIYPIFLHHYYLCSYLSRCCCPCCCKLGLSFSNILPFDFWSMMMLINTWVIVCD